MTPSLRIAGRMLIALGVVLGAASITGAAPPTSQVRIVEIRPVPKDPATNFSAGYRLGLAHGRTLRTEIKDFVKASTAALQAAARVDDNKALQAEAIKKGVPPAALVTQMLTSQAREFQPFIPKELLEEMKGVAAGAEVTFDSILLINTFLTLAEQAETNALLALPARCTNVVLSAEATSMGQLLHASTLDWGLHRLLATRSLVSVMEPEQGHPFLSVTWPGMVGTLRAMNAGGLALTEESCAAKGDTSRTGIPIPLLMRQTVQHDISLPDAVERLVHAKGTCGYKITVSDGVRLSAQVVEVTASKQHVRRAHRGVLFGVRENPTPGEFVGPRDATIPASDGSSHKRYEALKRSLEAFKGPLRAHSLSTLMASTEGGIRNPGTLMACLFEPQQRIAHVALGPGVAASPLAKEQSEYPWHRIDLRDHLSKKMALRYRALPMMRNEAPKILARNKALCILPGTTRWDIWFESPIPSGHAFNDSVPAELWLPDKPKGIVIHMPAWKEPTLAAHRFIAAQLAMSDIATVILPLPYQGSRAAPDVRSGVWTLSANLARTRQALVQGLADALACSRLLETEYGFAPARQATSGISLGAHIAAVAYGAYPERFHHCVPILAGGNVHEAFMMPNRVTGRIQAELKRRGVTLEEAAALMHGMDPLHHIDAARKDGILFIAADEDKVVAPKNTRLLAKAYGNAPIVWLSGGHYAPLNPLMAGKVIRAMRDHLLKRFGAVNVAPEGSKDPNGADSVKSAAGK